MHRKPALANRLLVAAALAMFGAAAASPAAAAPTCAAAAVTLDDQRDLAALRAAVDAACPCDAFDKRGAYRRCTRDVLAAALQSGELRADCKRTANKILKQATCGSDRVACGRVGLKNQSYSCRIGRDAACSDNARLLRTECAEQTHCADVVDWTAGTCFDVRKYGSYLPGYRVVSYTKDSAYQPGTPRVLDTSIWYPAPPGSGTPGGAGGGVANAPIDASGGPYPVVLFSHGSCGYSLQSVFLTTVLASHGFIVVAPPHPGNTIGEFPTCGSAGAQVASAVERPQDMTYVLDQIIAAGQDPGSPFFGAVDETRVAMTGHSFGGLTTFLVTNIDPRIKVAIPMAPATPGNAALQVPSLFILGNIDSVVSNANARAAYDRSTPPKLLVEIEQAGHYAFSNLCFAGPDCNPPVTLTQPEAHARALRYILPFLKVHLEGNAVWEPFLGPPAQPGFLHDRE